MTSVDESMSVAVGMQTKVGLLLVAYENESEVADFVSAFNPGESTRVLVASNSSTPAGLDRLRGNAEQLAWFPDNPGYLAGALRMVELDLHRNPLAAPDWYVLSNTDLALTNRDLLKWLGSHDSGSPIVLGPNVVSADGRSMNPYMVDRMSSMELALRAFVLSFGWSFKLLERRSRANRRRVRTEEQPCFAVHGSFVAFSAPAMHLMCSYMSGAPLFSEELIIGDAAEQEQIPVLVDPSLTIPHVGATTTASLGRKRGQMNSRGLRFALVRRFVREPPLGGRRRRGGDSASSHRECR